LKQSRSVSGFAEVYFVRYEIQRITKEALWSILTLSEKLNCTAEGF
jgi:hypothetical protein